MSTIAESPNARTNLEDLRRALSHTIPTVGMSVLEAAGANRATRGDPSQPWQLPPYMKPPVQRERSWNCAQGIGQNHSHGGNDGRTEASQLMYPAFKFDERSFVYSIPTVGMSGGVGTDQSRTPSPGRSIPTVGISAIRCRPAHDAEDIIP